MSNATSLITCKVGKIEFFCRIDWTVCPGEPMVRYYPDGSGYPGSDPSFDCVDHVECIEAEWCRGWDGPDEDWGYATREDRPGAFAIAERIILADIEAGEYHDDLFDNAEDVSYA